jgi:hypothetical protein
MVSQPRRLPPAALPTTSPVRRTRRAGVAAYRGKVIRTAAIQSAPPSSGRASIATDASTVGCDRTRSRRWPSGVRRCCAAGCQDVVPNLPKATAWGACLLTGSRTESEMTRRGASRVRGPRGYEASAAGPRLDRRHRNFPLARQSIPSLHGRTRPGAEGPRSRTRPHLVAVSHADTVIDGIAGAAKYVE